MKETTLMEIEKISLVKQEFCLCDYLMFTWEEVQQDSFYGNEEIQVEIEKEKAVELIKHLKEHFNL